MVTAVVIHLSKTIECATPRVDPNVNSELWVTMVDQHKFMDSNQCTTLEGGVDSGGGCVCDRAERYMGKLYIFCSILLCAKKLLLKKYSILLKKTNKQKTGSSRI